MFREKITKKIHARRHDKSNHGTVLAAQQTAHKHQQKRKPGKEHGGLKAVHRKNPPATGAPVVPCCI